MQNFRAKRLGTVLSTKTTLFGIFLFSLLFGFISVWQIHSRYLGESREWGMNDSSWLPDLNGNKSSAIKPPSIRTGISGQRDGSNDSSLSTSKNSERKILSSNNASESVQSKNLQSPKASQQNRVFCAVPFIWTPSAIPVYNAIHASWGKRCHIIRFFVDPVIGDDSVGFFNMTEDSGVTSAKEANMTLPNDVVVLHDMRRPWHTCVSKDGKKKENCRNIFEKVWRMLVYVAERLGSEYDAEWFVKVDHDTWLFPEHVDHYVRSRNWSYDEPHYFGHVLNHRLKNRGVSIVAGGAVFYSRAALLAATEAFRQMPMDKGDEEEDGTCRDSYTGTEEVVTAVCLKEYANITAEPAVDSEGREQVSLYELSSILTYNRTFQGEWWFWEGKKKVPCHDDGEDCLADLPLAFHHYKDSRYFLDFEKEFYGSVMKGEDDETLARKDDGSGRVASRHWGQFDLTYKYLEKVRAAMKKTVMSKK